METEKKESKKQVRSIQNDARRLLGISILLAAIAFLSEVKPTSAHQSRIWPIRSNYLMPNICMLVAYIFMAFFLIAVIMWLVGRDEDD